MRNSIHYNPYYEDLQKWYAPFWKTLQICQASEASGSFEQNSARGRPEGVGGEDRAYFAGLEGSGFRSRVKGRSS